MMNPNYVHTITLYRRQRDGSYSRNVLRGCFWKSVTAVTQNGTEASQSNTYTVRIPKDKATSTYEFQPPFITETGAELVEETGSPLVAFESRDGTFRVTTGDIVVKGECPDWISDDKGSRASEVLNRYKPEAFRITAFSDNTSHRMDKHYRLGG